MSFLRPATTDSTVALPRPQSGAWTRFGRGRDRLVDAAAARPYLATITILAANVALAAAFLALGELLFADAAELFRELMPGTWLSFAELLFIAAVAWAIDRELSGSARLRLDSFWGLSAAVFLIFAIDEITQATIYLADLLAGAGALAPAPFKDLDAFLLVVLFLAAGLVMIRHVGDLFRHLPAVGLLGIGVLLGIGSQTLDSLWRATEGEFVAEESLKLAAEAFLIGGYLLVLHRIRAAGGEPTRPDASRV
jgi:hypothetical protein